MILAISLHHVPGLHEGNNHARPFIKGRESCHGKLQASDIVSGNFHANFPTNLSPPLLPPLGKITVLIASTPLGVKEVWLSYFLQAMSGGCA
jgi:hypothetical protein